MSMAMMIDLETLDTLPTAMVFSGAYAFFDDETGRIDQIQEMAIDVGIQDYATISPKTVAWHIRKNIDLTAAILAGEDSYKDEHGVEHPLVIGRMEDFLLSMQRDMERFDVSKLETWSHGASFDLPLITFHSFYTMGSSLIDFRNHRDTRTRFKDAEFFGFRPKTGSELNLKAHIAKNDVKIQIHNVVEAQRIMRAAKTMRRD